VTFIFEQQPKREMSKILLRCRQSRMWPRASLLKNLHRNLWYRMCGEKN